MYTQTLTSDILTKIIDGSPIPSFVIDKTHTVIQWNTALESLSGIKKRDVIGTNGQWRAFYVQKRPVMADLIVDGAPVKALETYYNGKRSPLVRGAYQSEEFFPDLGKGGKWLHITVSPIRDGKTGILGAVETLEDVTQRKKAEQKLRQSETNFKKLFESALDSIWANDLKGNIKIANKAATELTGYSMEELVGKNIRSLLDKESLKLNQQVCRELVQEIDDAPYEVNLLKKDGTAAICMVTTNIIVTDGKPRLFQNIARDVTQEKHAHDNLRHYLHEITRAQEEERKRIARDLHDDTLQMLTSLTRELNSYIHRNPDLCMADAQFLENFKLELNQGVKNVQNFSQALRLSVLDDLGLVPALRSLVKNLQNSGIPAELQIVGTERRMDSETESLLFRIVQEALTNIRKHSQATEACIQISFLEHEICVNIKDNGKGFLLPNRLDDLPRNGKLGLVGIEERVRLLGGVLEVKSDPGQGTNITVHAPI